MNLAKGLAIVAGAVATGVAVVGGAPILTVSAPLWGIMGTTYTVNTAAAAGIAAAAGTGFGLGNLAGQTGGSLVIEGIDCGARSLADKLKK